MIAKAVKTEKIIKALQKLAGGVEFKSANGKDHAFEITNRFVMGDESWVKSLKEKVGASFADHMSGAAYITVPADRVEDLLAEARKVQTGVERGAK